MICRAINLMYSIWNFCKWQILISLYYPNCVFHLKKCLAIILQSDSSTCVFLFERWTNIMKHFTWFLLCLLMLYFCLCSVFGRWLRWFQRSSMTLLWTKSSWRLIYSWGISLPVLGKTAPVTCRSEPSKLWYTHWPC